MSLLISGDLRLRKEFQWNETVWNPSMISTALWLDAADSGTIATSGGEVTQINDKSGNARNFTSAPGSRPSTGAATLNSKNILTFSADYFTSVASAATWKFLHDATKSSVFAVAALGTTADPNTFYGLFGNNGSSSSSNVGACCFYDDRVFVPRNNAVVHQIGRGGSSSPVSLNIANDAITPNTANILAILGDPSNGTLANRGVTIINGGAEQKNNTDSSTFSDSNPTFNFQIGAAGNNVAPLTGSLAEFIIVSDLVSSTTRQKLEGYLAHKWGLTASLPIDHPYKTVEPTP
jgi:hypothetical protein